MFLCSIRQFFPRPWSFYSKKKKKFRADVKIAKFRRDQEFLNLNMKMDLIKFYTFIPEYPIKLLLSR